MPAQSKSQQRLFGMALAQKKNKMKGASKKVKELAKGMSEKKLKEFASTKHKGLKESFVLNFEQFITESEDEIGKAYITPEGELKGLEYTPEEELEIASYDDINRIKNFFEEVGATDVTYSIVGGLVAFRFEYEHETLAIMLDLDNNEARLLNLSTATEIFSGSADSLFDLIAAKGFEFIKYGQ